MDPVEAKRFEVVSKLLLVKPGLVIEEADKGCIPSTLAMINAVKARRLPLSHINDAFKVFTSHLAKIATPKSATVEDIRLADIYFTGTSIVCANFLKDDPIDLHILLSNWPSLLTWARALVMDHAGGVKPFLQPLSVRIQALLTILDAVRHRNKDETFRRVQFDPHLLELVVYVWLMDAPHVTLLDKRTCIAVVNLYIFENDMRREAFDCISGFTHGKEDKLVGDTYRLLSASLKSPTDFEHVTRCADILSKFAFEPGHPLAMAVWKGGISVVPNALVVLSKLPSTFKHDPLSVEAWGTCFALFSTSAVSAFGGSWMLQAYRNGLLYTIATFSPALVNLRAPFVKVINIELSRFIPAFLVLPSILTVAEADLGRISKVLHKQVMSSPIGVNWKTYVHYFFERFIFHCHYEFTEDPRSCGKCENPSTGRPTGASKICNSCKGVLYCSSKCQTADWKDHKKDCKIIQQREKDVFQTCQPHWQLSHFRHRLVTYDTRRHLPGIRALAKRKHPGVAMEDILIRLDYCEFPPTFDVLLASEVISKTSDPKKIDLELCHKDILESDGELGFLNVILFDGVGGSEVFQTFSWPVPDICSLPGSSQRTTDAKKNLHSTAFLDTEGRPVAATWDIADELMHRCKLTPDTILNSPPGTLTEIRENIKSILAGKDIGKPVVGRGTTVPARERTVLGRGTTITGRGTTVSMIL
ncbi:hypothetical protein DFH11DRAFT_869466 [Phellopilus nigrolimitatus]|nr:hypothetical protein DFH11DRAFT_869466 [Phellopilus nigrolimitatus]